MTLQPLLLLDVDGVVNDLEAVMMLRVLRRGASDLAEQLGVDMLRSHGHWLAVPYSMPEWIRELTSRFETWWCTTRRELVNDDLAAHRGVGPFPVLDPGGGAIGFEREAQHARPRVSPARAERRPIAWIEDFEGRLPDLDGVTYVDTGGRGCCAGRTCRWTSSRERPLRALPSPARRSRRCSSLRRRERRRSDLE
jgi:hypothetical protein